jgi:hypothetical protein
MSRWRLRFCRNYSLTSAKKTIRKQSRKSWVMTRRTSYSCKLFSWSSLARDYLARELTSISPKHCCSYFHKIITVDIELGILTMCVHGSVSYSPTDISIPVPATIRCLLLNILCCTKNSNFDVHAEIFQMLLRNGFEVENLFWVVWCICVWFH